MRSKLYSIVDGNKFLFKMLLVEFKKRHYVICIDKSNKIIDMLKYKKENIDYFLIYDNEI